ncbi:MAG: hypothetical protein ABI780_08500 [Ardenticatenales bacterium]
MTRSYTIRIGVAGMALAVFAVLAPYRAIAQPKAPSNAADQQYADWVATYGHWSPAQAAKAGYLATDVCVTAPAVGLPASMGAMGRHFVNPAYIEDGKADADAPDIVLFDADDRVVGLEFEVLTVIDPIPSVGGVPMVRTPADPGVDQEHLSLHVFFVGDPADRYQTWNPAVNCGSLAGPSGTGAVSDDAVPAALPASPAQATVAGDAAPPTAADASAASDAASSSSDTSAAEAEAPAMVSEPATAPEPALAESSTAPSDDASSASAPAKMADASAPVQETGLVDSAAAYERAPADAGAEAMRGGPDNMPVAGAGDWLPGGNATLLALVAGALVALAAAGRVSAARRL